MKNSANRHLAMVLAAGAVLVAANLGVWIAASRGSIGPVENAPMWSAFVVLNVVSILWAATLLGLQPLVVALSYVAGGFLAFQGVRGMEGVNMAEITTSGATCGAFGALAVGNATAKVRLAFFKKGQAPFVFIIAALLVFDVVINSVVSGAGTGVLLNAVVFPFVLAGVIIGVLWTVLCRFGIGHNPTTVPAFAQVRAEMVADTDRQEAAGKLVIEMPAEALDDESDEMPAAAAPAIAAVAPVPVVEAPAPKREVAMRKTREEEFFPLEIDKSGEPVAEVDLDMADEELSGDPMNWQEFDSKLYDSGSIDAGGEGGVMVREPMVEVALDLDVEEEAKAPEQKQPAPKAVDAPAKKAAKDSDWLAGHLDLLNKLK